MKTYKIEFKKKALKFISGRTLKQRQRIFSEISKLPLGGDVTKMEGFKDRYRLRVGDVRIIYDKMDEIFVILIVEAGHRGDVYK